MYSSGFSKLVVLRILVLHILVQQFTCGRARIDIPLLIDILWTGTHYVARRLCWYTDRVPRGPGKPPGNTSRRHRTSSFTGAKLAPGMWCGTLVCVCLVHTGQKWCIKVYSTHCVVRGSLSSHSQAPRSKLELPPVINSASPPLLFLFLPAPPFPKTLLHRPVIALFVLQKFNTLQFFIAFSSFWEEVESYPVFHHQTPKTGLFCEKIISLEFYSITSLITVESLL